MRREAPEIIDSPVPGMKIILWEHGGQIHELTRTQKILDDVIIYKGRYENYMAIRQAYPDAYVSLEFDLRILSEVKRVFREIETPLRSALESLSLQMADEEGRSSAVYSSLYGFYTVSNQLNQDELIMHLDMLSDPDFYNIRLRIDEASLQPITAFTTRFEVFKRWVQASYEAAGYTWRYFMYYNANSPAVQPSLGKIKLSPNVFEVGVTGFPIAHYPATLEFLDKKSRGISWTTDNPNFLSTPEDILRGKGDRAPPFTSWTKIDIINAIHDAGLATPTGGHLKKFGVLRSTAKLGPDAASFPKPFKQYIHVGIEPERENYVNRSWTYIALYRRLFNTMSYVNWTKAFREGLVGDRDLPKVAEEFGLDPSLPPAELKRRIQEVSEKRVQLSTEIASLIPAQSELILYQPASIWLKPVTRYQFRDAGPVLQNPYEQFVAVTALCQDQSIDTKEFMLKIEAAGMVRMLPPNTEGLDKTELCDYLLDQINYQADKYERLYFDCNDPDISMQSILNSLDTMELRGIVKDLDLTKIQKVDLCRIINKYLDILMETKALQAIGKGPELE